MKFPSDTKANIELLVKPPRGKAVAYAEELGINTSFEEASSAVEALGVLYHQRVQVDADVRDFRAKIAEREHELLTWVRETFPSAPTQAEREYKFAIGGDERLATLFRDLRTRLNHLGEIEAEIRTNEMSARTANARMTELAGYFNYLAASKESLTADRILGQIP